MPLSVSTRVDRLQARSDLAQRSSCSSGDDYWYRPGQLLVHRDDEALVADELRRWEARRLDDCPVQSPSLRPDPIVRYELPHGLSVHAAVRRLRRTCGEAVDAAGAADVSGHTRPRVPRVTANHVFFSTPNSRFGPGDSPEPATPPAGASAAAATTNPAGPFVIGILDTGLVLSPANPHLPVHQPLVLDPARDSDTLDSEPHDRMLDDADAHGGFIVGILRQEAPAATLRVASVLLGDGADEADIAEGIRRLDGVHVLNLSLGGNTDSDLEPWTIRDAIESLDPRPVVVAAAGNDESTRPFWPAAMTELVVGVGAVDARQFDGTNPPPAAEFTNTGPWVQACAHGVKVVSTYVDFDEQAPVPGTHPTTDPDPEPKQFDGWAAWSGTSFAAPLVAARIVNRAASVAASDPFDAVHQAAADLLGDPAAIPVPGLGVFVP